MSRRRIYAAGTAGAALAAMASPVAFSASAAAASSTLVVNEVYGGGGNSGATLKSDFVELASAASSASSVDGWAGQYEPSSGTSAWQVTPLTGSVDAGGLYLVAEAAGSGGTADLPPAQATGSINMSA